MRDSKDSSSLFLVLCSNAKRKPSGSYRLGVKSISDRSEMSGELFKRRSLVFDLLRGNEIRRAGATLKDLPYNKDLRVGPDITFGAPAEALYLEAKSLYEGSFYRQVGVDSWDNSRHHVLIVSAFYGLVLPNEQIQRYSCHLPDDPKLRDIWSGEDFITQLLEEYIGAHKIERVFDLLGEESYRRLFNWSKLSSKSSVQHIFSRQNAGPAALPVLGQWLNRQLIEPAQSHALYCDAGVYVDDKTTAEPLAISDSEVPPFGWPDETQLRAELLSQEFGGLMEEVEKELKECLGDERWQVLENSGKAVKFVVSAVSWLRLKTEMNDYSPVVIQISKAVESVGYEKILKPVYDQIESDILGNSERAPGSSYSKEKIFRILRDRAIESLHRTDRELLRFLPKLSLVQMANFLSYDSIRSWLRDHSGRSHYLLEHHNLGAIPNELRTIGKRYRNGLAHRSSAHHRYAKEAVDSILGQFDGVKLQRSGTLILLLDRVVSYQKKYNSRRASFPTDSPSVKS